MTTGVPTEPESELMRDRYDQILNRVAMACETAGRNPSDVTIVAVSKTFPDSHIRMLYGFGHRDFGENKVQELSMKHRVLSESDSFDDIRWHMIGHLQRNKARDVVRTSAFFHALDSERLAAELDKRAAAVGSRLRCLVQVNISQEPTKHGLHPDGVHAFITGLARFENLNIQGLMAMAEPASDPETVRPGFLELRRLLDTYPEYENPNTELRNLSMGMTQDFEIAIQEGATHIRIGSAIFGPRSCMLPL